MTVVKVQRPLAGDMTRLFVNDEPGAIAAFVPVDSALGRALLAQMGDEVKAFFYAAAVGDGVVSIEGPAPWQEW